MNKQFLNNFLNDCDISLKDFNGILDYNNCFGYSGDNDFKEICFNLISGILKQLADYNNIKYNKINKKELFNYLNKFLKSLK